MKQKAHSIYTKLESPNAKEVKAAMGEYLQLVDQFYEDNKSYLAPQQYETAKKDFEYFMALIEMAIAYESSSPHGTKTKAQ